MKKIFFLSVVMSALISLPLILAFQAEAIEVANAAICKNVVNREIVGEDQSFSTSVGKLYCFSKVIDVSGSSQIVHVWYYGDTERARVSLAVSAPAWRTYSSKIIQPHEIGPWRVEVLDSSGNLLRTLPFSVTP